mgnify:CR=1 FL=1
MNLMVLMKKDFNSTTNHSYETSLENNFSASKKIIFGICSIAFSFFLVFGLFNLEVYAVSEKQNNQLIERVSKDYTKKFCNGIAFGLSKESAMKFANKENNLVFQNKKGFDSLNKELVANNIAISVIDRCGYSINLFGDEGIKIFANDYISMNNIFVESE